MIIKDMSSCQFTGLTCESATERGMGMSANEKLRDRLHDQLFKAVLELQDVDECYEFFEDLCTIQEMKAISSRLEVARMLKAGDIYEDIVKKTGASTATISRIKRCLMYGTGGYEKILDRLMEKYPEMNLPIQRKK